MQNLTVNTLSNTQYILLQFLHSQNNLITPFLSFLLFQIKFNLTLSPFPPPLDLVENRICHNLSTIQLNGGVNNEPPKIPPSASPPIATTCLSTTITTTTTTSTTATNNSGLGAVKAPIAHQENSDVEANTNQQLAAETASANSTPVEPEEEEGYSLLKFPWGKSCFAQFTWLIIWPIHLLFRIAIPDCKKAKNNKIFPLTFVMCIVWIGSLSYVVAWMITIIGK